MPNNSSQHSYLRSHRISGDTLSFDLDEASQRILAASRQAATGHTAETLVKEGPLRLTILGFTRGSELREHQANGPISIEVRSGQIDITAANNSYELGPGDVLVLDRGIQHSLRALADSVVLLTLALLAE